jgi:hypothetical protein
MKTKSLIMWIGYERLSPCPHDSHKIKKYFLYKPKDRYLMKISYTSLKRDLNFNKDIIISHQCASLIYNSEDKKKSFWF